MKDMDSGSDGSEKSDKDSEEEESEEGSDEGSSSMPIMDLKRSNSNWTYDKKSKVMSYNGNGSWFSMITKKPNDKFTIELCTYVTNYMVGFIEDSKYNQNNSLNYNSGYCWYANTNALYGVGTGKQSWSVNGGTAQGTKIGCVWNKKKRNYYIL